TRDLRRDRTVLLGSVERHLGEVATFLPRFCRPQRAAERCNAFIGAIARLSFVDASMGGGSSGAPAHLGNADEA
ncbi:MAG: hypothetical protein ACRDN8_05260, partial [Thermoleophilaceae bacterium]